MNVKYERIKFPLGDTYEIEMEIDISLTYQLLVWSISSKIFFSDFVKTQIIIQRSFRILPGELKV